MLTAWGLGKTHQFVFLPIFENLACQTAKCLFEALVDEGLADALLSAQSNAAAEALQADMVAAQGLALKEFLQEAQDQMLDGGCPLDYAKEFVEPFERFLRLSQVKRVLAGSFLNQCPPYWVLQEAYKDLLPSPPALPVKFDWDQLCTRYHRRVEAIREQFPRLKAILEKPKDAAAPNGQVATTPPSALDNVPRNLA